MAGISESNLLEQDAFKIGELVKKGVAKRYSEIEGGHGLRLVVDTNVRLKALIGDSKVRAILLSPSHQFAVPEYAIEEVEGHLSLIVERSGLWEGEVRLVLSVFLTNIQVMPKEDVMAKWSEAEEIMGSIDRGDTPCIASSMGAACDGNWSDARVDMMFLYFGYQIGNYV